MTTLIPDKRTVMAPEDAIRHLAGGYARVYGSRPSYGRLLLLAGQSALETGNWQNFHNFNFGNHKASGSDEFAQIYTFNDDPTDPGARYAAFKTPEDGAEHYVRVLTKRDHWRKGFETGTPKRFIDALSTPPVYFTANPQQYLVTMTNRMDKYADIVKKYSGSVLGVVVGILVTLAGGAGAYLALKK